MAGAELSLPARLHRARAPSIRSGRAQLQGKEGKEEGLCGRQTGPTVGQNGHFICLFDTVRAKSGRNGVGGKQKLHLGALKLFSDM